MYPIKFITVPAVAQTSIFFIIYCYSDKKNTFVKIFTDVARP